MGYGDIGPFGATRKTPHLDRMAKEGMKLTDFYVSSSACTPSRSALLTGCYADRIGMGKSVVFPADTRGLNPSEITIAEILKEGGYTTGCFGKWHLGDQPQFMPLAQGFDEYEGIPYSNDMWVKGNPKRNYPPLPWMKQDKPVAHIPDEASQAAITDAITDAAVDFIKRHRDEPFFAYVPHSAVHYPFMVTPDRLAASGDDVMTALVTEIDNSTGRILQTLRDLGIAENTFVLFTNDNGGGGKTSPGPLRGAKFGPKYEGHMRVATLAWWPGEIPAGSVSSEVMTTTDVLPTVAKLAGLPAPADRIMDGKDVSEILLGKPEARSPHDSLYYENDGIRQGQWKLVRYRIKADSFAELYDLDADLGERNNIADQHPDRVATMTAALDAHVVEIANNVRPAAFVENPKPLLPDASGLPTLAEYMERHGANRRVVHHGDAEPPAASALPLIIKPSDRPDTLVVAVNEVHDQTTPTEIYEPSPDDLLIADFEDGNGDWIATGTAFDPGARRNRVTGIRGRGCVNSFLDGDRSLGTLTSPRFKIERKRLNFLIGGGNHPGKTGLVLLVDGEAVRTASGFSWKDDRNQEIVDWKSWDVSPFVGKEATLQIIDQHSGGWGHIVVDHIIQSDRQAAPTHAVKPARPSHKSAAPNPPPSREIEITGKHLILPIAPRKAPDGEDNMGNSFHILVDGVLVHQFWAIVARREEPIQFWSYLDMSEFVGKTATIQLVRGPHEEAGAVLAQFESSDELRSLKPFYTETGRPQFHFSQKVGWNNDVNGMVYSDGLYHLSWQCNPTGLGWGNMYWGHAVGRDLVHWEEMPRTLRIGGDVAKGGPIHPAMALGQAFSGSAAVDEPNTLGFQKGDQKTLIAAYTSNPQGDCLVCSTDGGRTYHHLNDHQPVIVHPHPSDPNWKRSWGRDPKLIWHEPSQKWIIVTYRMGSNPREAKNGRMAFYSSADLNTWTEESLSEAVFHECPEFIELPVDGDPNNKKWMLFDATPKYQIGVFDGKQFTPEFEGTRQTIGGTLKAAQCFSNAPDGRAICMVWARVKPQDPQAPYNQGFTLPLELSLRTVTDGVRCYANPVKELESLRQAELASVQNKAVEGEAQIPLAESESLLEIALTLRYEDGNLPDRVALQIGENWITYDVANRTFPDARLRSYDREDGKLDLRVFVDNATVEVFGEHGAIYYLQPRQVQGESVKELLVKVEGGVASIESLKVHKLKSIWPDDFDTVISPDPR